MHGDLNNVRNADDGERIHKQKAASYYFVAPVGRLGFDMENRSVEEEEALINESGAGQEKNRNYYS